jgi:hypothetical protein
VCTLRTCYKQGREIVEEIPTTPDTSTAEMPAIPWGLVFHTLKKKGAYPALVVALVALNIDWGWVQGVC